MRRSIIKTILILSFLSIFTSQAFSVVSEQDRRLNKNIETFTPVYTAVKRIPWEFWGRKYLFEIQLTNREELTPKPSSDINFAFIGYKNKNTKVRVVCHKLDPMYSRILSTDVIGSFSIDDFSTILNYTIPAPTAPELVEISLSIARDKHNIKVMESGRIMNLFKTYEPARIFNVRFKVKSLNKS